MTSKTERICDPADKPSDPLGASSPFDEFLTRWEKTVYVTAWETKDGSAKNQTLIPPISTGD